MNAADNAILPAARPFAPIHPTHKFRMLLKREYWENKGGFFWLPVITGVVSFVLAVTGFIFAEIIARRAAANGGLFTDGEVRINGIDLAALTQTLDPDKLQQLGQAIDFALLITAFWPSMLLAFVVFFYGLGCLYDDRKDRSVLFWKSLPVSDTQTVLSKLVSATVIAPAIAAAVGLVSLVAHMLLFTAIVMIHGGNPMELLWGPANPLRVIGFVLASLPVYAVWALPTVGWLMLCSAWARNKPFLWAVAIPVFSGILVSGFKVMQLFGLEGSWYWKQIVGRMLMGTVMGIDMLYRDGAASYSGSDWLQEMLSQFSTSSLLSTLAMPATWISAGAGVVMIIIAIRLRRWRDEG